MLPNFFPFLLRMCNRVIILDLPAPPKYIVYHKSWAKLHSIDLCTMNLDPNSCMRPPTSLGFRTTCHFLYHTRWPTQQLLVPSRNECKQCHYPLNIISFFTRTNYSRITWIYLLAGRLRIVISNLISSLKVEASCSCRDISPLLGSGRLFLSKLAMMLLYQSVHGKGVHCGNRKDEYFDVWYPAFLFPRKKSYGSK